MAHSKNYFRLLMIILAVVLLINISVCVVFLHRHSIFLWTVSNSQYRIASLLLRIDDQLIRENYYGYPPIYYAVRDRDIKMIKWLLWHGVNLRKDRIAGELPAHFVYSHGNMEIVRLFIEYGMDIDERDSVGKTIFYKALAEDNKEMLKLLLDNSVNINARDYTGSTPLHFAATANLINAAKYLISNNVDLSAKNYENENALDLAVRLSRKFKSYDKMVDLLTHAYNSNVNISRNE